MSVTVAVDANGADLGAAEVAAGAAIAAELGVKVRVYGPAEQIGEVAEGVEVIDAPISIAKEADPARAARSTPEASIVQAAGSCSPRGQTLPRSIAAASACPAGSTWR